MLATPVGTGPDGWYLSLYFCRLVKVFVAEWVSYSAYSNRRLCASLHLLLFETSDMTAASKRKIRTALMIAGSVLLLVSAWLMATDSSNVAVMALSLSAGAMFIMSSVLIQRNGQQCSGEGATAKR